CAPIKYETSAGESRRRPWETIAASCGAKQLVMIADEICASASPDRIYASVPNLVPPERLCTDYWTLLSAETIASYAQLRSIARSVCRVDEFCEDQQLPCP